MSLKKAKDYLGNEIQVDSAIKDAKGQTIHSTYINKNISDGTISKNIGFDTNGNVVKQTPQSSGMTNPMTQQYDLIIGGSSGTPTRLAKPDLNNKFLKYTTTGGIAWDNARELPSTSTAKILMTPKNSTEATWTSVGYTVNITSVGSTGGAYYFFYDGSWIFDSGAANYSNVVAILVVCGSGSGEFSELTGTANYFSSVNYVGFASFKIHSWSGGSEITTGGMPADCKLHILMSNISGKII